MSRRPYRHWLWTLTLLPIAAAPASASSITCYGSIVISTLGTEGMAVPPTDGAITPSATPSVAAVASGSDAGKAVFSSLAPLMGAGSNGARSTPTGAQGKSESPTTTANSNSPDTGVVVVSPESGTEPDVKPTPVEDIPPPPIDTTVKTDPPVLLTALPAGNAPQAPVDDVAVVINDVATSETPEPATLTLMAIAGLGGVIHLRRRKS